MKLLKGHQKARQHSHSVTEAQYLRQCIKALCDAGESAIEIIRRENAGDPYLNPENATINHVCTHLEHAIKGARTHGLGNGGRVQGRIIGGASE